MFPSSSSHIPLIFPPLPPTSYVLWWLTFIAGGSRTMGTMKSIQGIISLPPFSFLFLYWWVCNSRLPAGCIQLSPVNACSSPMSKQGTLSCLSLNDLRNLQFLLFGTKLVYYCLFGRIVVPRWQESRGYHKVEGTWVLSDTTLGWSCTCKPTGPSAAEKALPSTLHFCVDWKNIVKLTSTNGLVSNMRWN